MQVKIDMDISHIYVPMIITMTIAGWERLYSQLAEAELPKKGGVALEFMQQVKRICTKFEPLREADDGHF